MRKSYALAALLSLAVAGILVSKFIKNNDTQHEEHEKKQVNTVVSKDEHINKRVEKLTLQCQLFASPYCWQATDEFDGDPELSTISMTDVDGGFEDQPRIDFIYRWEEDSWIPHSLEWSKEASDDWVQLNVNKLCDVQMIEEEFRIMMLLVI